ncbi:MAG TPA: hypothetical protein VMU97_00685, partial [Candidatus Dormibacteraeota bacterium]|nr:hypothetical protein [Candidatus Dormibacteraeota bacterium]
MDTEADGQLYDLQIADWQEGKPKFDKSVGEVWTSVVTLEDDSRYVFRKTVPLEQAWETSVDFSPPLATRVNGFNTYIARQLSKRGMHSRIVGTNQSHNFNLLHDAQATLHILNEDDRRQERPGRQTSAPGESLMIGYSMGQMKELAELGLAPAMGRDIVASIGLDPCLGEKVDYGQELRNLGCSLKLLNYLGREALEIPKGVISSLFEERDPVRTLLRIRHLAGTAGLSPAYFSNIADKWKVLATGETGKYLDKIPNDAIIVIHFFKDSYFNDSEFFESALGGRPFFRPIEEDGLHLSGARSSVVRAVA